jgi:hypothetical protein
MKLEGIKLGISFSIYLFKDAVKVIGTTVNILGILFGVLFEVLMEYSTQ